MILVTSRLGSVLSIELVCRRPHSWLQNDHSDDSDQCHSQQNGENAQKQRQVWPKEKDMLRVQKQVWQADNDAPIFSCMLRDSIGHYISRSVGQSISL